MTDTMGAGFLLLAMCVPTVGGIMHGEVGHWAVLVRLILVYAFLTFTSPISTHALARAAIAGGVEPWTNEEDSGA
jgi:multicomponent Na+:H+ antiporter subunit G